MFRRLNSPLPTASAARQRWEGSAIDHLLHDYGLDLDCWLPLIPHCIA
jgi:hypothetical protein